MGIGIKNISVHTGYSYIKYLQDQLLDIEKSATNQKDYNGNEIVNDKNSKENIDLYTRCEGALAEEWGLSGGLTAEKLATIANLELGKDSRTSNYVKIQKRPVNTIKNSDGVDILISAKDVKNGFYMDEEDNKILFNISEVNQKIKSVRKSAIETTYTLDSTFSYFYQTLQTEEDKDKFVKDFFDSARIARQQILEPLMRTYDGQSGKTMTYSFMHKDNRDGLPFIHIHDETSNLVKLPDGRIQAIEIPEIREKDFHAKMDCVFKSNFMERFQQSFPNAKIEAYDKEFNSITDRGFQDVKDWRVAFDKASLASIRANSTAKEKIGKKISEEKKYLIEKIENAKSSLDEKFNLRQITEGAYKKEYIKLTSAFETDMRNLKSKKHDQYVHSTIKADKNKEGSTKKDNRLVTIVRDMDLKAAKESDVGLLFLSKTNEEILANLTNINPFFTRNSLIVETTKTFGKKGISKADEILKVLESSSELISGGYSNKATKQEKYTLKSLCNKECQNIQLMNKYINAHNRTAVKNIDYEINKVESKLNESRSAKEQVKLDPEQRDLIKTVFNEKQSSIIIGVPGAGKSLAISFAAQIAEKQGYKTLGIAPTGKVAAALKDDAKINSMTVDKLNLDIESGKNPLTSKHIVFLDEASMVGTRNWNTLLNNLNGAKLVVVGDVNQIQSVAVGNTLSEFMKEDKIKNNVKYLTEIRRQKNKEALSIVTLTSLKNEYKSGDFEEKKLSGEHIAQALELMKEQGRIKNDFATTKDKVNGIADDYLGYKSEFKRKIIVASTNDSINNINEHIQKQRIKANQLSGESLSNGKNDFYAGDRIVMQKNEKLEYNNGDFGTITSIKDSKAYIKLDNNKTKILDITDGTSIGLCYATSIHKSQGMTVTKTMFFGENSIVNNSELFNVAVSRATDSSDIYVTAMEEIAVMTSFKRPNKKVGLIDIAKAHNLYTPLPNLSEKPEVKIVDKLSEPRKSISKVDENNSTKNKFMVAINKMKEEAKSKDIKTSERKAAIEFTQEDLKKLKEAEIIEQKLKLKLSLSQNRKTLGNSIEI